MSFENKMKEHLDKTYVESSRENRLDFATGAHWSKNYFTSIAGVKFDGQKYFDELYEKNIKRVSVSPAARSENMVNLCNLASAASTNGYKECFDKLAPIIGALREKVASLEATRKIIIDRVVSESDTKQMLSLAQQIEQLKAENKDLRHEMKMSVSGGVRLQQKLAKARVALEFYGEEKNWEGHVCDSYSGEVGQLFVGGLKQDDNLFSDPVLLARQTLQEIGDE